MCQRGAGSCRGGTSPLTARRFVFFLTFPPIQLSPCNLDFMWARGAEPPPGVFLPFFAGNLCGLWGGMAAHLWGLLKAVDDAGESTKT